MRAGVLATEKQDAYAADSAPTTHPIRQEIVDVATAAASFDDITYPKGAAVLKQLVAFVGEDVFVAALRSYFRKHAWGNTTLDDLIAELAAASGRDLSAWVEGWLETSGTDRLSARTPGRRAHPGGDAAERPRAAAAPPADRGVRRPGDAADPARHALGRGGRRAHPDRGAAGADLLLVNDEDLTFATVRPDPASLELILDPRRRAPDRDRAHRRPDHRVAADVRRRADRATASSTAVWACWPRDRGLGHRAAADPAGRGGGPVGTPRPRRDDLLTRVADLCLTLAEHPARRTAAVRALAQSATTAEQLESLAALATDPDLQWRRLTRLAELDRLDDVGRRAAGGRRPQPGRLDERRPRARRPARRPRRRPRPGRR